MTILILQKAYIFKSLEIIELRNGLFYYLILLLMAYYILSGSILNGITYVNI